MKATVRDTLAALGSGAVRKLLPAFAKWVRARLARGETPAMIERDLKLDAEAIEADRKEADEAFERKFGEPLT